MPIFLYRRDNLELAFYLLHRSVADGADHHIRLPDGRHQCLTIVDVPLWRMAVTTNKLYRLINLEVIMQCKRTKANPHRSITNHTYMDKTGATGHEIL